MIIVNLRYIIVKYSLVITAGPWRTHKARRHSSYRIIIFVGSIVFIIDYLWFDFRELHIVLYHLILLISLNFTLVIDLVYLLARVIYDLHVLVGGP